MNDDSETESMKYIDKNIKQLKGDKKCLQHGKHVLCGRKAYAHF